MARLTQREEDKLDVIHDALVGKITNRLAATILGISPHQVKRLQPLPKLLLSQRLPQNKLWKA